MSRRSTPLKAISINKPSKKDAKKRIQELSEYLSKQWYTPIEKQSRKWLFFPLKSSDYKTLYLLPFGGPNGELAASTRYITQRYTMPDEKGKALLTDIGTEELGHMEMVSTMVYQLTQGATMEEIKAAGLQSYYTEHGCALFPNDANGVPFNAMVFSSTGDPVADLAEDCAAEQKARAVYENLMNQTRDPDLLAPLSFLRQREIVHYERFRELYEEYVQKYYQPDFPSKC